MDLINFIYILIGIAGLYYGGEYILSSSLSFADKTGIPKIFSACVIIGFGTSAPELFVSLIAVGDGVSNVAVGNVLGSNIANILLVGSIGMIIYPMVTKVNNVVYEKVFLIISSLIPIIAYYLWGYIGFTLGLIMLVMLFTYFYLAMKRPNADEINEEIETMSWGKIFILFAISLGLLIVGSKVMIMGAVGIAQSFGISEAIIGLSIVAIGTSLPEIAATVASARRREGEMIIGNIMGSNIFNIMLVLATASVYKEITLPWNEFSTSMVMIPILSAIFVVLIYTKLLNRFFGILGLIAYSIYIYCL
ncbi:MAG: sodium:calcium antiporter [Alphaproteobacteria bacterium]